MSVTTESTRQYCSRCGIVNEARTSALPTGWKNRAGAYWCGDCWRESYVLRAFTFPVVKPLNGTWQEFRADLNTAWRATTRTANWIASELYGRDMAVVEGAEKLPKMPPVDDAPVNGVKQPSLYMRAAHGVGKDLPGQSVSCIVRAMVSKYKAKRFETVWRHDSSLPTFRFPQPFPIHNQSWSVAIEDERPVVEARLPGQRWKLVLKGGPRYRRQLAAVKAMASGQAACGEMALLEQNIDGKPAVMCKLVAWIPRSAPPSERDPNRQQKPRAGTLFVRSAPNALLVAFDGEGNRLWGLHWDHVRRWQAEHATRIQRLAYDRKAEQRPRADFSPRLDAYSEKYDRRMKSAVQQAVASLANFADRCRFAEVVYNDSDKSWCEKFRWFELKSRLSTKLDEYGIKLTMDESPVPGEAEFKALVKLNRKDQREKKWTRKAKENIGAIQQLQRSPAVLHSQIEGS